jgi:hypothetical protein
MQDWFPHRRHADPSPDTPIEDIPRDKLPDWLIDEARRMRAAVARAKAEKESRRVRPEERPTND